MKTNRPSWSVQARKLGSALGAALIMVASAAPREAEACSFGINSGGISPLRDEVDVPRNAQILWSTDESFGENRKSSFKLEQLNADGGSQVIPFSFEEHRTEGSMLMRVALVPEQPLEAETLFRLTVKDTASHTFQTGSDLDTTPPAAPELPSQSIVPYTPSPLPSCYSDSCWSYDLGGSSLHFVPQADAVTFDVLAPDGGVIASRVSRTQTALFPCSPVARRGIAFEEWNLPPEGEVLIRAVDSAGNVSETTRVVVKQTCEARDPWPECPFGAMPDGGSPDAGRGPADSEPPATGCSSAPSTFLAGLAFVGLLLRRRSFGRRVREALSM